MTATKMLTTGEAAKILDVRVPQVLGLIHSGRLAATNVSARKGRATWRISPEALKAFIDAAPPDPEPAQEKAPPKQRAGQAS